MRARASGSGVPRRLAQRVAMVVVVSTVTCAKSRPVVGPLPSTNRLIRTEPAAAGMTNRLGSTLDSIAAAAIRDQVAPGLSIAVGRYGRLVHLRGYGATDWAAGSEPVSDSTLYDMASLTKVVATTTAAMILEEEGRLVLDRPVRDYLPEFDAQDKAPITVRMLLTHSGGLEAYAPLYRTERGRAAYLAAINARPLRSVPGTQMVYSDWDIVILQLVLERIAGQSLDAFVDERIWRPLGLRDTRFTPDTGDAVLRRRIAATAIDTARGGLLRGTVHDGNAWAIGGVSGHAGLFSSARDLATFATMLLNGGNYGDARVVSPQTVARWTARQGPSSSRALGWDTPFPNSSAGRYFSPRSIGHTGFTGTSIWIDPERGVFAIVLMNRVNSRGSSENFPAVRRAVADAVQSAILDAPLVDWESRVK